MSKEEIIPNEIKRGDLWNKPKTPYMLQFEKEKGESALTDKNQIKGKFTHWLFKKKLKTTGFAKKRIKGSVNLKLIELASNILKISETLDFKISSRGWCYLLEGEGLIIKSQFENTQEKITKCRKNGLLPIDLIAEDETRQFYNVEELDIKYIKPKKFIYDELNPVKTLYQNKNDVSFWNFQDYYIQVMAEKGDIVNLFTDICEVFCIPIGNAKGWSDLNSRNLMALRYKEAEERGLKPVILYYTDLDPAGVQIFNNFKKNLEDIEKATGWNPDNLITNRFGLTPKFIDDNDEIKWINNLITSSGKNLADPNHTDYNKPYVQDYLKEYGERKCESNAILKVREKSCGHLTTTIIKYLGENCFDEYNKELKSHRDEVKDMLNSVKFRKRISRILRDVFELEDE